MSELDPFDEAEAKPAQQLVTAGRYRLPNLDGSHHTGGWMRASNLAAALSDTRALSLWEQRMIMLGMRARPDLLESLAVLDVYRMDPNTLRKELEDIGWRLKEAAKADEGARRGNARHGMVEHWHTTGEEIGTPVMRRQLRTYRELLEAHRLRAMPGMQERIIIVESLNVAGKFDNILEDMCSNTNHIGDLKTQRKFWSLLEVEAQLSIYSRADAIWDEGQGVYIDMPRVCQETGIIMWMPKEPSHEPGTPALDPDEPAAKHEVLLLNLDLERGWRTAQLAKSIVDMRSESKSVAVLRGCVRPLPASASVVMRTVEEYAARFRAVTTVAEGRRVRDDAKADGLWGPELMEEAKRAAARIKAQEA